MRGGRGIRYQLPESGNPKGGPGSKYFAYVLYLSVISLIDDCNNPFGPSPSRCSTDNQAFGFRVDILSLFYVLGEQAKIFYLDPNPLLASLIKINVEDMR